MHDIPVLTSIAPIADTSDVWFLDIWGVVHNGVRPYPSTVEAAHAFRNRGGTVLLVSNAPRPRTSVAAQLNSLGVDPAAYDGIITSGDVSASLISAWSGREMLHIGPERDRGLFAHVAKPPAATAETADVAVCTGLFSDETETPEDYRELIEKLVARSVPMICANPDKKVERGGRIIYCAGAIADRFEAAGGRVSYAGKPYVPIYDQAIAEAEVLRGMPVAKDRVLAIGDGVKTDIEGARRFNIRSVFVASGVHVRMGEDLGAATRRLFSAPGAPTPIGVMSALSW